MLARARLLRARDVAVPLAQPRLRDVRRLPRRAQEPQAQAAAQGARSARAPRSSALDAGSRATSSTEARARRPRSVLSQHDRQPRRPRLPAARVLPPRSRSTLPDAMRMVEVVAGGKRHRRRAVPRDRRARCTAATGAPTRTSICCTSRPRTTPASSARSRSKLPLFEAGAQGEHKLLRGFEPTRDVLRALDPPPRARRARSTTTARARRARSTPSSPSSRSSGRIGRDERRRPTRRDD